MQNLAKMNLHATLAVLLSRFSFQLAPEVGVTLGRLPPGTARCRACGWQHMWGQPHCHMHGTLR